MLVVKVGMGNVAQLLGTGKCNTGMLLHVHDHDADYGLLFN